MRLRARPQRLSSGRLRVHYQYWYFKKSEQLPLWLVPKSSQSRHGCLTYVPVPHFPDKNILTRSNIGDSVTLKLLYQSVKMELESLSTIFLFVNSDWEISYNVEIRRPTHPPVLPDVIPPIISCPFPLLSLLPVSPTWLFPSTRLFPPPLITAAVVFLSVSLLGAPSILVTSPLITIIVRRWPVSRTLVPTLRCSGSATGWSTSAAYNHKKVTDCLRPSRFKSKDFNIRIIIWYNRLVKMGCTCSGSLPAGWTIPHVFTVIRGSPPLSRSPLRSSASIFRCSKQKHEEFGGKI